MMAMMTMPIVGREAEPLSCLGLPEAGAGDLTVIDRENGGDDRGHHRRIRPVVHRPGAKFRPAQAQFLQPAIQSDQGWLGIATRIGPCSAWVPSVVKTPAV